MKKILLVSALSLLGSLGLAMTASDAEACNKKHGAYHCHWKHGHRHCHGRPVAYYGPKPYKSPVYFVAAQAPTPQCHWYLGRQYCALY
ncbi:MAG TPA: hypothetical protein VFW62_09010 [bacterium]|nr:hypothetical protein [bacterium]